MDVFKLMHKSMIPVLIKRSGLFLFAMDCYSLFLYTLGTRQGFMDTTQSRLLGLSVFFGLSLVCASLYGLSAGFRHLLRRRGYYFMLSLGAYLALGFFGIASAAFAAFILILAGGNNG